MAARKLVHAGDVDDDLVGKVYKGGWSTMVLCSEGGDLYACRAIVDYFQKNSDKDVIVTGKCFSAATAIAVAASRCYATPGTRFLVHRPHIKDLSGKADDIDKERSELETWLCWYLDLLGDRTGTSRETWEELVREETYFGVKVALDLGLVDEAA